MAAAKMAMDDSGVDMEKVDRDRFGVIVSSGIGGLKTLEDQHTILLDKGPTRVSPFTIPMLISNMASGLISMEFGLQGPNLCIVTACATSNNAIGESWRMIKFGDADIFLAGGSEASIVPIGLAAFRVDESAQHAQRRSGARLAAVGSRSRRIRHERRRGRGRRRRAGTREGPRRENLLRADRVRTFRRRLPHDRAAAGWRRRRARDADGAATREDQPGARSTT